VFSVAPRAVVFEPEIRKRLPRYNRHMPLPVIQTHGTAWAGDLARLFSQVQRRWLESMAEAAELPVGTALSSRDYSRVYDANNICDAALPPGTDAAAAVRQVNEHFSARGTRCAYWTLRPSAPPQSTAPLAAHLLELGYRPAHSAIMSWQPSQPLPQRPPIMVIPARASYAHWELLEQESAQRWPEAAEELVAAHRARLDDPHVDALLAMKEAAAAGSAALLCAGELGLVGTLYVAAAFRQQGVGKALMVGLLDLAHRAVLRHVFLEVEPDNHPAVALYEACGFTRLGTYTRYWAPWTHRSAASR